MSVQNDPITTNNIFIINGHFDKGSMNILVSADGQVLPRAEVHEDCLQHQHIE